MYKCEKCGGLVEELGEMALSDGGCVCAQKKVANSLQQLKPAILLVLKTAADYQMEDKSYNELNDILQSLAKRAGV